MLDHKSLVTNPLKPGSVIGIFGGGQLGRMICFAAHKLGYKTVIFSDTPDSPASEVTNHTIIADYNDQKALEKFAQAIDIATLEFENIPVAAVEFVNQIKPVYPGAQVLKITQNRLIEKDFLTKNNIKVTDYCRVNDLAQLKADLEKFNHRAILKISTMGYDGKGQYVLKSDSDLEKIWQMIAGQEMILEKFADFEQEISVIAARGLNGQIACFAPLTNIHKNGILDQSIYPAKISDEIAKKAQEIAVKIVKSLDLIGIIAVEFFVVDGELLVNELAPRPHNSGHFSMNGAITCQFEQLIRAITGMKLGSAEFHSTGYMKNLIGNEVKDLNKYLENDHAKIHLYGKKTIAEGRKMGHINILEK
jgi:5-(carboxyamino)imidazole ribonucleotide synthase